MRLCVGNDAAAPEPIRKTRGDLFTFVDAGSADHHFVLCQIIMDIVTKMMVYCSLSKLRPKKSVCLARLQLIFAAIARAMAEWQAGRFQDKVTGSNLYEVADETMEVP